MLLNIDVKIQEVNLKLQLLVKLSQEVKTLKEGNHFVLDQEVGQVKEEKLLDVDGNVKI